MVVMYNYPNTFHRGKDKWSDVNNPTLNCVLMDSLCHRLHNNRLLAIQSLKYKTLNVWSVLNFMWGHAQSVRLFAPPFPPLIKRNHAKAFFLPQYAFTHLNHRSNGTTKLRLPKICGRYFMVRDGGSKRYALAGRTARPVLMKELLDGVMKNQRNTFQKSTWAVQKN